MNESANVATEQLITLFWILGIFLGIFVLLVGAWILIDRMRARARHRYSLNLAFLQVALPKKTSDQDRQKEVEKDWKETLGLAKQFFRSLYTIHSGGWGARFFGQKFFSFEMTSRDNQIFFHVVVPRDLIEFIEKQITSFYPDAVVEEVAVPQIFSEGAVQRVAYLTLKQDAHYPLRSYQKAEADPMNNLTNALSKIEGDDGAAIQMMIRPVGDEWSKRGKREARRIFEGKGETKKQGILSIIFAGSKSDQKQDEPKRLTAIEEERVKAIEEKCSDFGFETVIRVISSSRTELQAESNLRNILGSFTQFTDPDANSFKPFTLNSWWRRRSLGSILKAYVLRFFHQGGSPMVLSSEELASIFHFPNIRYNQTSAIKWQGYKNVSAPSGLPSEGILMGYNVSRGVKTEIRMKDKDRFRHFYAIGQTGTGKTTILTSMIIQDILAGKGVCVMDPHGDMAADVISYIPKARADDVIYFNPADTERPLGLNLLETSSGTEEEKDFIANDALQMMIKLYGDEVFGPRLQDYFRNGVLTLMDDEDEGGALTDIMNLFTNDEFQRRKRAKIKNPIVRDWWENKFDKMGDTEKQEIIPYFQAKFASFTSNAMMRNIIGQTKSSFDFFQAMNEGKIILVNLSKGSLGEFNSTLLGMIVVSKIQMSAFKRGSIPEDQRRDFFFYIDEFQNFVTPAIESILSEARKYRLSMNLAHQYISQLESSGGLAGGASDKVKNAVFGNIGSMASLKVSSSDAEYLSKEFAPEFSDQDLNNFDVFKGAIKLSVDGQQTKPFSFDVVKRWEVPEWKKDDHIAEAIKQLSRLKYGKDKEFVNREIISKLN